jgi:GTP cyclohydrolase I
MDDTARALHAVEQTGSIEGERAVEVLLRVIGEDPDRDGTWKRAASEW